MSKRDRHDGDRGRDRDRRDSQPDDEGQRRSSDAEIQEGESLTALKAILSKVATLLNPLQLTPEESIRLVEQLYGGVLAMDVMMAGEADDTRKSSVLAHIQNTNVSRAGDKIVVEYPTARRPAPESGKAEASPAEAARVEAVAVAAAPTAKATETLSSEVRPTPTPPSPRPANGRTGAGARTSRPRVQAPRTEPVPPEASPQQPLASEPAPPDSEPIEY